MRALRSAINQFLIREIVRRKGLSRPNVVKDEPRMIGEDLLRTDAGSEFAQDQFHRDTRTAYHRLAAHDLGVDLDPLMRHGRSSCADYNAQCSTLARASPPYLSLEVTADQPVG